MWRWRRPNGLPRIGAGLPTLGRIGAPLGGCCGELSCAVTLAPDLATRAWHAGQLTFHIWRFMTWRDSASRGRLPPHECEAVVGVEGRLAPVYAAHATALVAADGAALNEVASGFARIGVNLLAAEAAAEAASAYRATGRRSSALAASARAAMLAAACEGAHTPALDLPPHRPDLTPREQEIAGLAARGLTSRAIAERLVISVRTVDHALQHVYRKLGLTSRAELRLALGPNSTPEPPSQ